MKKNILFSASLFSVFFLAPSVYSSQELNYLMQTCVGNPANPTAPLNIDYNDRKAFFTYLQTIEGNQRPYAFVVRYSPHFKVRYTNQSPESDTCLNYQADIKPSRYQDIISCLQPNKKSSKNDKHRTADPQTSADQRAFATNVLRILKHSKKIF